MVLEDLPLFSRRVSISKIEYDEGRTPCVRKMLKTKAGEKDSPCLDARPRRVVHGETEHNRLSMFSRHKLCTTTYPSAA